MRAGGCGSAAGALLCTHKYTGACGATKEQSTCEPPVAEHAGPGVLGMLGTLGTLGSPIPGAKIVGTRSSRSTCQQAMKHRKQR